MKHSVLIIALFLAQLASAQRYFSKTGKISFSSKTPMEIIEAENTSASTVMDMATGNMEWAVLVRGFRFEKELMQDHFNENYMESTKYPKAKFRGTIDNVSAINISQDGVYKVSVPGQLEIHGITQPITAQGTITVKNGQVSASSALSIAVADYGIEIPKLVADNIAKRVDISVEAVYQPVVSLP